MRISRKSIVGILLTLVLLVFYLPLISKVNFMQNDDWYYYKQVSYFLQGNFALLPDLAPTFYTQGILGAAFAFIFGLQNLPILTFAVSLINLLFFYLILTKTLNLPTFQAVITSLIFYFNPLYQYTIFGFMTEQYILLFVLLGFYFFYKYEKSSNAKYLLSFNISAILGFFVKQISLVLIGASCLYFLIKGKWRLFLKQALFLGAAFFYYTFLFPKTFEMQDKGFTFPHLLDFKYTFSLVYGIFIYPTSFSIPLVIQKFFVEKIKWKDILGSLVLAFVLFYLLQNLFSPMTISWGEFPYFENTWERTGFMAREIHGTKYQFRGIYDLYFYWDLAAKILIAFFLGRFLFLKKWKSLKIDFSSAFILVYLPLIILAQKFFDRYILLLVPVFLIALTKKVKEKRLALSLLQIAFVFFLGFYAHTLGTDFVFSENYVWKKAETLAITQNIPPEKIYANSAWNEKYHVAQDTAQYIFSYDSPDVGGDKLQNYKLLEKREIQYPFNIHINPYIYLYESVF